MSDLCFICGLPGATKTDTHDRIMHEGGCPVVIVPVRELEQLRRAQAACKAIADPWVTVKGPDLPEYREWLKHER
jgi:hypothetical protein